MKKTIIAIAVLLMAVHNQANARVTWYKLIIMNTTPTPFALVVNMPRKYHRYQNLTIKENLTIKGKKTLHLKTSTASCWNKFEVLKAGKIIASLGNKVCLPSSTTLLLIEQKNGKVSIRRKK